MITLIRLALQVILVLLLLSVVIAIARPETGVFEKVTLVGLGGGLVWVAARVRTLGVRPA